MATGETYRLSCPLCDGGFRVTASQTGETVKCPRCGEFAIVPKALPAEYALPVKKATPRDRQVGRNIGGNRVVGGVIALLAVVAGSVVWIAIDARRPHEESSANLVAEDSARGRAGDDGELRDVQSDWARPDRPFWEWTYDEWVALSQSLGLRAINSEPGEFYISSAKGGCGHFDFSFENGTLRRVFVGCMSVDNGEPEGIAAVLWIWNAIDPGIVRAFEGLLSRRMTGLERSRLHRYAGTEYAFGWSANNKAFVEWVGDDARFAKIQETRAEIAELVLCWEEYLEATRAKLESIGKRGPADVRNQLAVELWTLGREFGDVDAIGVKSVPPCFAGMLETAIPDCWPECVQLRLLIAAARIKDVCDRYSAESRRGAFTGKPFDDMVIVLSEEGRKAVECPLGNLRKLVGSEDRFRLPRELSEGLDKLSTRAFSAHFDAKGNWKK